MLLCFIYVLFMILPLQELFTAEMRVAKPTIVLPAYWYLHNNYIQRDCISVLPTLDRICTRSYIAPSQRGTVVPGKICPILSVHMRRLTKLIKCVSFLFWAPPIMGSKKINIKNIRFLTPKTYIKNIYSHFQMLIFTL